MGLPSAARGAAAPGALPQDQVHLLLTSAACYRTTKLLHQILEQNITMTTYVEIINQL